MAKLVTICEHTLDVDRLRPGGWVLDAGCRGFEFSKALAEGGYSVLALDPSLDVRDPHVRNVVFDPVALVGLGPRLRPFSDNVGNAGHLTRPADAPGRPIPCTTIKELMARYGIGRFEAVKLDVEGAEYEILAAWPGDVAEQVSIEFHDFLGLNPMPQDPEAWYRQTFTALGYWYDVLKHEALPMHCAGVNYWDTLLVRKPAAEITACSPVQAVDATAVLANLADRVANIEFLLRDGERKRRDEVAGMARALEEKLKELSAVSR